MRGLIYVTVILMMGLMFMVSTGTTANPQKGAVVVSSPEQPEDPLGTNRN